MPVRGEDESPAPPHHLRLLSARVSSDSTAGRLSAHGIPETRPGGGLVHGRRDAHRLVAVVDRESAFSPPLSWGASCFGGLVGVGLAGHYCAFPLHRGAGLGA